MLSPIFRLQRLWYLILILSTGCFVSDITVISIGMGKDETQSQSPLLPILPMVPEIPTIIIFAYCIWGKSQPFLLPTSSPSSNPCTRSCRHMGTCLLALLWLMATIVYSLSPLKLRRFMAGITVLVTILILVEMIGSHRVGREQRRILKQEKRKLKLQMVEADNSKNNGSLSDSNPSTHSRRSLGQLDMNGREGLVGGSDDASPSRRKLNDDDDDLESGEMVEIVRPDPVDKATVMLQQQQMYEQYQRQHQQQYQFYLMQQHMHAQGSGSGSRSTLTLESGEPVATDLEGKVDDILQESSYKIEIDLNDPLEGPSSSSAYIIDKRDYMYPPSAPSEVSLSSLDSKSAMALAIAAESSLAHQPTLPASTTASGNEPLHKDDQRYSSGCTPGGNVAKGGLFCAEMRSLSASNPISDEEYDHIQGYASAPPYEQGSSGTRDETPSREPRSTLP